MRVIVAGCGYVGSRAAAELVEQGHEVWGVRRSDKPLPEGVTRVTCDLAESAANLPEAEALVYCASADGRDEAMYRRAYVQGLQNCIDKLEGSLKRVIFTSSTAVYGQNEGEWVNESSETKPTRFTGDILLEAEQLITNRDFESSSLRLSGIYGPTRTRLVQSVHKKSASGSPRYTNRIHRDDCAGAIVHLLQMPQSLSPLYVGVDNDPALSTEVYEFVANILKVDAPAADSVAPIGKRCSNKQLTESGYTMRFDSFRDGYPAIIEEYLGS